MVVPIVKHVLTAVEGLHNVLEQGARPNITQQTRTPHRKEARPVLKLDERESASWRNRTRVLPNTQTQTAELANLGRGY